MLISSSLCGASPSTRLAICIITGADAQLYEWSCSPLDADSNRYTLPDLRYEDAANVASIGERLEASDDDNVDVFPVPSTLNCSGTVSAVQYCYAGRRIDVVYGRTYPIFTLLTLEQNGLSFEIADVIDVSSVPVEQICMERFFLVTGFIGFVRYCCDTLLLGDLMDRFSLPKSSFAFGVMSTSTSINQIRYIANSFPEFQVEQYSTPASTIGTPTVGGTFTLTDDSRRTDMALRLLQFVISKYSVLNFRFVPLLSSLQHLTQRPTRLQWTLTHLRQPSPPLTHLQRILPHLQQTLPHL